MPAAVAIPLIMAGTSAATSVIGAKMASNASKKAADQQAASATQAMGVVDRAYAPYLQAGQQAAGMLGRLVGPTAGTKYASPAPSGTPYNPAPQSRPGTAMPRPPMDSAGGMPQSMGGMVGQTIKLQSPDGSETMDVPAWQAEAFIARGARRVR